MSSRERSRSIPVKGDAGAAVYLTKPVDVIKLHETVAQVIHAAENPNAESTKSDG